LRNLKAKVLSSVLTLSLLATGGVGFTGFGVTQAYADDMVSDSGFVNVSGLSGGQSVSIPASIMETMQGVRIVGVVDSGNVVVGISLNEVFQYNFSTGVMKKIPNKAVSSASIGDTNQTLSTDGSKLVFLHYPNTSNQSITVANFDDSSLTTVLTHAYAYNSKLTISPDGSKLAYFRAPSYVGGAYTLYTYDVATKKETTIEAIGGSESLRWAQDSKSFYYLKQVSGTNYGLYRYDITAGTKSLVWSSINSDSVASSSRLSWISSDETKFIFSALSTPSITKYDSAAIELDLSSGTFTSVNAKLDSSIGSGVYKISDDGTKAIDPYYLQDLETGNAVYLNAFGKNVFTLSADGKSVVILKPTAAGLDTTYRLTKYDVDSVFASVKKPESIANLIWSQDINFSNAVSLYWDEQPNAIKYVVRKDGITLATLSKGLQGNSDLSKVKYVDEDVKPVSSYRYSVTAVNSLGESTEVFTDALTKDVSVPFANKTAKKGDIMVLGGSKWYVLGPNKIVSSTGYALNATSTQTSVAFSSTTYPYPKMFMGDVNNVAYKMDFWVRSKLSAEELSTLEKKATYPITDLKTNQVQYTFNGLASLPTYEDVVGSPVNFGSTNAYWIANPAEPLTEAIDQKAVTVQYKSIFVPNGASIWELSTVPQSVTSSSLAYPVLTLKADTLLEGSGTGLDPYFLYAPGSSNNGGNTGGGNTGGNNGGGSTTPTLAAPANFKASKVTGTSVTLSWDAVNTATIYEVKRNGASIYSGNATSFTDSTVSPNNTYIYTVSAANVNSGGTATSIQVTTTPSNTIPTELAEPTNIRTTARTTSSLKVAWNGVEGADLYEVKRNGQVVYDGNEISFNDTGLTASTPYTYEVIAKYASVVSKPGTATFSTLAESIPYPSGFTVTKATHNEVALVWNSVVDADHYVISRNGAELATVSDTKYLDTAVAQGADYTYGVRAVKGTLTSEYALKTVTTPTEAVEGAAPSTPSGLKVTRAYADKVKLQWSSVSTASKYEIYRDGSVLVYSGPLTAITDETTGPEETYSYRVIAVNEFGKTEGDTIRVTTPAEPISVEITPSQPVEGTITFNIKVIEGADTYYVERNPQWKYTKNGDGTYHLTYFNSVTNETRDYGNVTPVAGTLPFYEDGITPGRNYTYDVVAVKKTAQGEEVIAETPVNVEAPADGSGVTVPDGNTSNPGGGTGNGGTTPAPGGNTGGGNSGGSTGGGSTGGGSTGGSTGGGSTGGSVGGGSTDNSGSGSNTGSTGDSSNGGSQGSDGSAGGSNGSTDGSGSEGSGSTGGNSGFSDLGNNFAKDSIERLSAEGVIKGYADGTFKPNQKVTRAEFAIMVTRAMGYTSAEKYKHSFKDFDKDAWYSGELTTALNEGVTKGFTDNTYRPNTFIPREQASVMISNILSGNLANLKADSLLAFKDATKTVEWAKEGLGIAVAAKVMGGYPDGTIQPKREITRAETAVMIDRLLSAIK
jgi:hypothetical protein